MSGAEESRKGDLSEDARFGSGYLDPGHALIALVVVLENGLPQSRVTGLMLNIRDLPGVRSVTNLTKIDQTTLDYLLLKPTPRVLYADPKHHKVIREYWRRKKQPGLGL